MGHAIVMAISFNGSVMCLISFHWSPESDTPLTMVANRDEFHQRPAKPAHFWDEYTHVLAGKDLTAGGTWMGVNKNGHFAALTNVRQFPAPQVMSPALSRGVLVLDFLSQDWSPADYIAHVHARQSLFEGFNLVVGNKQHCWYFSNRSGQAPISLAAGLYGLSNAELNSPWPKTLHAKQALGTWLNEPSRPLYELLHHRATFPKDQLPNTGVSEEWEMLLSSPFIVSEQYGTRASTGLQIGQQTVHLQEASYDQNGQCTGLVEHKF